MRGDVENLIAEMDAGDGQRRPLLGPSHPSTASREATSGEVKGQERPPWSRLRYVFHGWTVSHGLSPIAKPLCTKARWRSEPQRGGFIVARGKPRFAAPPRVSPRPAHRGRAHDHEYDRQSPSPPRAAPRFVATGPGHASVCIAPSKAREAVRGLFRARRPPVWHAVVGSPIMFSGTCTRGGAAKRGLPRATVRPPRCGSGGKLACHAYENSNGTGHILHIQRLSYGTETKIITSAFCPGLSPSHTPLAQGTVRIFSGLSR